MNKRKKRSKFRLNCKTCLMLLFVIYISYAIITQQPTINAYNREIENLTAQIDAKKNELNKLNDMEGVYQSDEFVEKVARERLGLVRSDETVFIDVTGK